MSSQKLSECFCFAGFVHDIMKKGRIDDGGIRMRKIFKQAIALYFAFLLFMSAFLIILLSFGYSFAVSNGAVWLIINILVEGTLTILCILNRKHSTKTLNTMSQLLPLFSLAYICILALLVTGIPHNLLTLHALFCFVSCYVISLLYKNTDDFRIVYIMLNSILLCLFLAISPWILMFGSLSQKTIVNEIASPNGLYSAIIIYSDQGALGGNLLVDIEYNISQINLGFGRFTKTKRIYVGGGRSYDTMAFEWQDNHTLLIRGDPYNID